MEDVPYRVLLESLSWTQARAGAFLGVSRQTSNAFATGRRAAPPAALKLLRVVLYCSLTMSREHYNRFVQACDLTDRRSEQGYGCGRHRGGGEKTEAGKGRVPSPAGT
jgi:hypothetical protein